jgi:hypothetical protein
MATTHETDDVLPIAESIGVVQFRGDPERLQSLLLPPPLDPVGDGDTAFAIVGDAVYPGRRQRDRSVAIEETEFREAAVGMPCKFEGDRYVVNPLMFLDRETTSFERGLTRGIGSVTKTKWHSACEGRRRITAGDSVAGAASHGGDDLFSYEIHLEEEVDRADLEDWTFEFMHYRHVSDPLAAADATSLANDVTLMDLHSLRLGTVWRGSGSLSFGDWNGEVLAGLVDEVVQGFHVTMGYEYGGERVVADAGDWGGHVE